MRRLSPIDRTGCAAAHDLATRALVFVASREDLVMALLEASGARGDALRDMAERPEFPGFMLDFILAEDCRVRDFALAEGIAPEEIAMVRARLEAGLAAGRA